MQEINKILNCRKEVIFLDFEGTQFSQEIFAIGAIKANLLGGIYPRRCHWRN